MSFQVVYNEEVRNLLHGVDGAGGTGGTGGADGDDRSNVLATREDPLRGGFITCHGGRCSRATASGTSERQP